MKLYYVECTGMRSSIDVPRGIAYVLATNPDEAYLKLRARLDIKNYGYKSDRELHRITLIAEDNDYPDCKMQLIT